VLNICRRLRQTPTRAVATRVAVLRALSLLGETVSETVSETVEDAVSFLTSNYRVSITDRETCPEHFLNRMPSDLGLPLLHRGRLAQLLGSFVAILDIPLIYDVI